MEKINKNKVIYNINNNMINNNTENIQDNVDISIEPLLPNKYIHSQIELLYLDLLEFYNIPENLDKFRKVINGNIPNISLRLIDWFSTNYAKKYYTTYDLNIDDNKKRFKVFDSYKLKLRAYGKDNFDAFSRGRRIIVPYDTENNAGIVFSERDKLIKPDVLSATPKETTIGQMNFFKWAIENNIVEYILENLEVIKKDMDSRSSTSKKKKDNIIDDNSKTRKKREELSVSASKCIIKEKVSITIKFSL
jgi:hypothetical protein